MGEHPALRFLVTHVIIFDRGRNDTLVCIAPPSEPDWRISRIRLSSRWSYLNED
jgi:hypothetical protein